VGGMQAVQAFIQAVWNVGEFVEIEFAVAKTVDRYFRAMARARAKKTEELQAAAEEKQEALFVQKMGALLTRELGVLKHGTEMQETMMELLKPCLEHIELLHRHLHDKPGLDEDMDESHADASEDVLGTESKGKQGTELKPLHERNVLDVVVDWRHSRDVIQIPAPERTCIVSNLPVGADEAKVRLTLEVCGPLKSLEFCYEWQEWSDLSKAAKAATPADDSLDAGITPSASSSKGVAVPSPKYTMSYAVAEFGTEDGFSNATRPAIRLFGLLVMELEESKGKNGKVKTKSVGRPVFPQDVRNKHTLLLRGLPWHLPPSVVLGEVARLLGSQAAACRLEVGNCRAFRGYDSLIAKYSGVGDVQVVATQRVNDEVPDHKGAEAAVLRFQRFEDAYAARLLLKDLSLAGQPVPCGFPPWRPLFCATDYRGQVLSEDMLVDLPLPRASAKYISKVFDPVSRFGTPVSAME